MAGEALRGSGSALAAAAVVLLAAGAASAAAGLYARDAAGDAADLLVGAAASFNVGYALLVAGLALRGAGARRRRRELARMAARSGLPAAPAGGSARDPPPTRRTMVLGVLAVVALMLVLVAAVAVRGGEPAAEPVARAPSFFPLNHDGAVRQAIVVPLAGPASADETVSQREFDAPAEAASLRLELNWEPAEAGAGELLVILEREAGAGWAEAGRQSGPGPLLMDALVDGPERLRYRVHPAGEGAVVVDQRFHVRVSFG